MSKYLSEFIGTFALVFCGTGSVIVDQFTGGAVGLVGIALAFGAIIIAMIYALGSISGAHINPAVTIALAVGKLTPWKLVPGYIISQVLGAIVASALLMFVFPESETLGATLPSDGWLQSFILEVVLTFFMMITILGVTSREATSHVAGIVIGLTVTGLIFIGGPISGGAFNPARSIGPAVMSGNVSSLWIYLTSPVVGTVLAMLCWKGLSQNSTVEQT